MVVMNLCPHDVTLYYADGETVTFPASGFVARCSTSTETVGEVNGIPVIRTKMRSVDGLPAPADGICYIVSFAVAEKVPEREDVFYPARSVRNDAGMIIGCKALGHV